MSVVLVWYSNKLEDLTTQAHCKPNIRMCEVTLLYYMHTFKKNSLDRYKDTKQVNSSKSTNALRNTSERKGNIVVSHI